MDAGTIIAWGVAALFFVLSVALLCGRGGWLIAGYNTATPEEKALYNRKNLCSAVGIYVLLITAGLVALLLWADTVSWLTGAFGALVVAATVALMLFINKSPFIKQQ